MDKGPLIGRGRTADIYAWGDTQVLKLFNNWCSEGMVRYELKIARIVQSAGLPVPKVEDSVIQIDDRRGILYQRVSGPSMLTCLRQQPWKIFIFARMLAELQWSLHACTASDLPRWVQKLERDIRAASPLTNELRQAALEALNKLPDGTALCHGDFHPDNVIMTHSGPVIIDWITAVQGDPQADVARSSLLLRMGDLPPGTPGRTLIHLIRVIFHNAYLSHYLRLSGQKQPAVDVWELPIAAARLNEGISSEENGLIELVRSATARA